MSQCDCEWGEYNPYGCDPEDCDWKNLAYEKDAILNRLKSEYKIISDIKKNLTRGKASEEELVRVMDITKAMQIMVDRLIKDFDMKQNDIKKQVGFEKDSMMDKMKMAAKLQQMKNSRRKKDGS